MEQSTLEKAWAQVGQVDLFQTNISEKYLTWGSTITAKVYIWYRFSSGISWIGGIVHTNKGKFRPNSDFY